MPQPKAKSDRALQPVAQKFTATLEHLGNSLGWVIVRVPAKMAAKLGGRGQIRVIGEISGGSLRLSDRERSVPRHEFRASLFPDGKGGHFLLVNKKMQKAARVGPGAVATFRLARDATPREITIPQELERALGQDRRLRRWFEASFNPSMRRYCASWVAEPKSAEARARRADQLAERLLLTLEAEKDLPPILKIALARDPRAAVGWERMSARRRRGNLLAIFYYRSPEAQQRRLAKVLEEAVAYAHRAQEPDEGI
jgi:uncharacterized protein YdeI (YjbR/CyaY-like superfamily)